MKWLIALMMMGCVSLSANLHTAPELTCEDIDLTPQGIYFSLDGEKYFAHYLLYAGDGKFVAGIRQCPQCGHVLDSEGNCHNCL